ncbi:MAG: helix-turn-helix transcriptional regulator [Candidatus Coproplasma sp.]
MARSENQKIKILRLYEYLKSHSNEEEPCSMNDIIKALEEQGIKCERKSIYSDIKILQKFGYDIKCKGYKYYLEEQGLTNAQLRILLDMTQSATFLTVNQTNEISSALSNLAGSQKIELAEEQVICFDKVKHNNNEVLKTIEHINLAIDKCKKVSFKYFHIGFGGKIKYAKDGERYEENPVGLLFNEGRYYFICYSDKYDDIVVYRVDRIKDMAIEWNKTMDENDGNTQIVGDLKDRLTAFGMWNTPIKSVTLLVDNNYIEDMYDKFGSGIKTSPYGAKQFTFTEKVNVNDTFFGWVASYGSHVKILSPKDVKNDFVKKINESLSQY